MAWYIISISRILFVCLRTIIVLVYVAIKYSTSFFCEYDILPIHHYYIHYRNKTGLRTIVNSQYIGEKSHFFPMGA